MFRQPIQTNRSKRVQQSAPAFSMARAASWTLATWANCPRTPFPWGVVGAGLVLLGQMGINASPAAIAAPLPEIQRRGHLIVGVKDNLRPLGYRNDQGELVGFEIDLARRLATELLGDEQAIEFVPLANRDRLAAVLTGQVDLVIAQVTATDDRRRVVRFSPVYYFDGLALITERPQLQQRSHWRDRRLGILAGSSGIGVVRSRLPPLELVPYDSYDSALAALARGEVDGFAGDASVLAGWLPDHPAFRMVGPLLSAEPLAIALPKGLQHDSLYQAVEQVLGRWQQSGWLRSLAQQWSLPH